MISYYRRYVVGEEGLVPDRPTEEEIEIQKSMGVYVGPEEKDVSEAIDAENLDAEKNRVGEDAEKGRVGEDAEKNASTK